MPHKCTNPDCQYGPTILAGYYDTPQATRADAYSQHEESWAASAPRYNGLCLNCWDDEQRDMEQARIDYDFDDLLECVL